MGDKQDTAHAELRDRGYRRDWQVFSQSVGGRRVEFWFHEHGPNVMLLMNTNDGWDLFIEADSTNSIPKTWEALDKVLNAIDERTELTTEVLATKLRLKEIKEDREEEKQ